MEVARLMNDDEPPLRYCLCPHIKVMRASRSTSEPYISRSFQDLISSARLKLRPAFPVVTLN